MKNIVWIYLSINMLSEATFTNNQIREMTQYILKKRKSKDIFENIKEPFVMNINIPKKSNIIIKPSMHTLYLQAILNNKAFINNKWLEINDQIQGYSVLFISKKEVVLQQKSTTMSQDGVLKALKGVTTMEEVLTTTK